MTRARGTEMPQRRRGAVAVQVAIAMTVMVGFAALTIDVGAMYNAKAELQRTADAAALAAAAMLGEYQTGAPQEAARDRAVEFAAANGVWGQSMFVDRQSDVTFGRAVFDPSSSKYDFVPTQNMPDAVRVTVRMTEDSANGPLSLFFASIFGTDSTELSADAIAMMVPRDIAVVADLSGSHNDDSELRHYQMIDINLHEVWDDFPGGIDDSPSEWAGLGYDPDDPQAAGPGWGYMKEMGYGTHPIQSNYDPTTDQGLIKLAYNQNWNDAHLEAYLASFAAQGYSADEIDAIMSRAHDSDGAWKYRTAVALGLARWDSGMPDGLWDRLGIDPADAGNGNDWVGSGEVVWLEQFGDRSLASSETIFYNYISGYMNKTWTKLYQANNDFKYEYGVKTFINYLLERRPYHSHTPEFADTNAQPMQAVKDATGHMMAVIESLDTNDQVSLEIYGTTAIHEVDLTTDYQAITDRLTGMQAAYYESWTNMGGGITRAIEELSSDRARSASRKIMILLTDGYANVTPEGKTGDYAGGRAYALDMAEEAAADGVRIFAVSVGAWADTDLMQEIAELGSGQHFHAEGTIEEYSEQLDDIFRLLGGQRPVELIE